jgi:PAP2 superfamily protein
MNLRTSYAGIVLITCVAAAGSSPVRCEPDESAPEPVRAWNQLALDTVRVKRLSDAQAACLFAMVNVAMYDAVNGIVSSHGNPADRRAPALVAYADERPQGHTGVAASAAAYAVMAGEFPDQAARFDVQLASDLAAWGLGAADAGQAWGALVGAHVRAARAADGSTPNETQPAGAGPGQFRAPWSGVQFRNLMPFGIADPSVYVGAAPPPLDSLDYAGAFAAIKVVGDAGHADDAKLATFQYWSLGSGTSQPPGAWLQIALAVTAERPLSRREMARLFALLSVSLADTVAPTVTTKFIHRRWRPATAIREADTDGNPLTDADPAWAPRAGGIGTSPEYWSGHSSFSAAGAAVLAGFFCADAIPFTLVTDSAPGGGARTYPSFSAAAEEAGRSRVLGGIHFESGNQDGFAAGRAVAAEILAHKLLRLHGPTHFGECPLGDDDHDKED